LLVITNQSCVKFRRIAMAQLTGTSWFLEFIITKQKILTLKELCLQFKFQY